MRRDYCEQILRDAVTETGDLAKNLFEGDVLHLLNIRVAILTMVVITHLINNVLTQQLFAASW
jgi:hypothetical protein